MKNLPDSLEKQVSLFFIVKGQLLLHTCSFDEADVYGDFLNYPLSHDEFWVKHYYNKYYVDFDYFPRGRILYNTVENYYILYHDNCIEKEAREMQKLFPDGLCRLGNDEHYQCHMCNTDYLS